MPRAQTKAALIQAIEDMRQQLDKALEPLTEEQFTRPGVCNEGAVKDILAHLLEWQHMVLGWYRAGLRGEVVKTPADDLKWNQLPALNQRIYEQHRDRPLAEIRAELDASHRDMLETIRAIDEDTLFEPGAYA